VTYKYSVYFIVSGLNIALNKVATQGPGTLSLKEGPQLAVDGNLATLNHARTCAHTTEGTVIKPAWWQVDLRDAYRITGIIIYNRETDGMY